MMSINLVVKLVVFSVIGGRLKIFLADKALPSGSLSLGHSLDELARRIFTKTIFSSLKDSYLEQLYTFSAAEREKTKIAVVYYILFPEHVIPQGERRKWVDCQTLTKSIPDFPVIKYALQRLRWKIEYTNVVYSLLPEEFTFSQLQEAYEAILGRSLDKRNFRKKILSLNILKSTGHKKMLGKARPAEMFAFKEKKLTFVEIL